MNSSDSRCCGSGVCIINQAGECWCGQVWNGEKMVHPPLAMNQASIETDQNQPKKSSSKENKNDQ
jgi:hypothetical protein